MYLEYRDTRYKLSYLGQMLLKLSEIWHTHLVYPSEADKKKILKNTYYLIIFNCKERSVGNHVFLVSPTKSIEGTSELKLLPVRHFFLTVEGSFLEIFRVIH